METLGLVSTVVGAALWFYGDYQGWSAYILAGLLILSSTLVAYLNSRYRFHLCFVLATGVVLAELWMRANEPRFTDVYMVSPSIVTLAGMAIILAMLGCVVGAFFRTIFGPEQHPLGF